LVRDGEERGEGEGKEEKGEWWVGWLGEKILGFDGEVAGREQWVKTYEMEFTMI
jgi:hypothetical protein